MRVTWWIFAVVWVLALWMLFGCAAPVQPQLPTVCYPMMSQGQQVLICLPTDLDNIKGSPGAPREGPKPNA